MTALGGAPELAFGGKAHRIFEIAQINRRFISRFMYGAPLAPTDYIVL
jgi:hypothetical protein